MFERYTEKARRVIFFARYEASQFGSSWIETEHLLVGLLREDKALAHRFLRSDATIESIREQIEQRSEKHAQVATSVDLPLSHESKRVLAYGAEESERMRHKHIGTPHLLLGLMREENCFAAVLLREWGLQLHLVREEVMRSNSGSVEAPQSPPEPPQALIGLLRAWQELGGITVVAGPTVGRHTPDFAIYAGSVINTDGDILDGGQLPPPSTPEAEIAQLQREIKLNVRRMENAIARHDFAGARTFSDLEREQRALLRKKMEPYRSAEPPGGKLASPTPVLCIEIDHDERFYGLQMRIDGYITAGAAHVWLLSFLAKRAYTVTAAEGLREFRGEMLRLADLGLELDLKKLFG